MFGHFLLPISIQAGECNSQRGYFLFSGSSENESRTSIVREESDNLFCSFIVIQYLSHISRFAFVTLDVSIQGA